MSMATLPFVLLEMQDAVHALLTGDAVLTAMVRGIHDADMVPENAPMPYITYGPHVDQSWPTFGHLNSDALFLLDIWSGKSRAEVYAILAEIKRLLGGTTGSMTLVMPDYGSCMFQYEWSTTIYNQDTKFWNGPMRYHAYSVELV